MEPHPLPIPRVLLAHAPGARAALRGAGASADLQGEVLFFRFRTGSLLLATVSGIPTDGFHGLHIHEHGDCCPDASEPFHCAGGHFNPGNTEHPNHAGDLPALLASDGFAYSIFYTGRFRPRDVIGRGIILHAMPDDFHTQPAGDAGMRIACGEIRPIL